MCILAVIPTLAIMALAMPSSNVCGRGGGRAGVGRVAGKGLMHKDFYLLILGSGKMEEVAFSSRTIYFSPAGGPCMPLLSTGALKL